MMTRRSLKWVCAFVCLATLSLVAAPVAEWSQTFDLTELEYLIDVLLIEDDGYALVGTVHDDAGTSQLRVIRLDALGAAEWTYTSTEDQDVVATSAIVAQDGGIVVAADRSQSNGVVTSVLIQKITPDGQWAWGSGYGVGVGWNLQHSLLLERFLGTLLVFNTAIGETGCSLHVIAVEEGGTTIGTVDCPGLGSAVATDLVQMDAYSYLLSAGSATSEEEQAGYLIQLRDSDHCGWMRQINGDGAEEARAVVRTVDDEIFVCGSAVPSATYSSDVYIAKFSVDGTQLWYRIYGGSKVDYPAAMVASPGGGVVVVGATRNYGGRTGILVFEIASGGEVLWSRGIGGPYDFGVSVHPTSDGGYIIGANCGPEGYSCDGVRIIKLSHD